MSMRALWFMLFVLAPLATLAGYGSTYGIGSAGGGVTVGNSVSGGTTSRLLFNDASGLVSTATPALGAGLTLTGALSGTSSNWTGQAVFSGVTTDISTGTNETLTITPNGTGGVAINSGTSGVVVTDSNTMTNKVDWADSGAFGVTAGGGQAGMRLLGVSSVPYLDFTNATFAAYVTGHIRGTGLVLNASTGSTGNITMTGGVVSTPVTPTTLSGDVTDHTGCHGTPFCRVGGGAADRLINSLHPHVNDRALRLCNIGTTNNITLVHASGLGTAAYRFTLPGAANKNIVPNACVDIQHDSTTGTWRGLW